MTEAPGKQTPSADPKPAEKSGPVKPPVLEGTARPAAGAAASPKPSEEKTGPAKSTAEKPQPQKAAGIPPRSPSSSAQTSDAGSGGAWLAAIGGGLIGLGAAYGLAWFGLWPVPPQTPVPADPRIAQIASAVPELQTVTSTVQDELATLNGRMSTLETSVANQSSEAAAAPDTELSARLDALASQVETLSATPAAQPDDSVASQTTQDIDALRQDIATLREEAAATASRLAEAEQNLATVTESTSAQGAADTELARLPLIFSSLESAFATGRSYTDGLTALRQAQPAVAIPDSIAGHAQSGLPRPDIVATRLHDLIPDILAGRPVGANAGWQDATMDWFRGVIAMRPAGSLEGDGPEAVVARLEVAVASRDFSAAKTELESLPETMRAAAAPVAEDIAALADADAFLSSLRAQALAEGSAE